MSRNKQFHSIYNYLKADGGEYMNDRLYTTIIVRLTVGLSLVLTAGVFGILSVIGCSANAGKLP